MPLASGSSRETISKNISEMVHAGHPQAQAVAAALRKSREDTVPAGLDRRQSAAELKAVVDALGCAADELCTRFDAYRFRADARGDAISYKGGSIEKERNGTYSVFFTGDPYRTKGGFKSEAEAKAWLDRQ